MTMKRATAALVLALCASASAQDWPGWRGPKRDGTSPESGFPLRWSPTENILWKTPVAGTGYSSPVITGDRVLLTSCLDDGERKLLCFDRRDGKPLWEKSVLKSGKEPKHKENSWASSTPVTDGKRVWLAFLDAPKFMAYCYDLDGNQLWAASPGEFHSRHGFCSSPLLWKDTVIFNGDQDAEAWIVALEQGTGKERWRADRPNRTRSYTPPVIFEAAGRPQMVLSGSKCIASYDPDTGGQIWIIDGPTEQYVASAIYAEGLFFVTGGFPLLFHSAIRPDGKGNVTATHELWRVKGNTYVPSPVAWGAQVYVVADDGFGSCLEVKTGQVHWKQRLGPKHHASPVAAEGRIYFTDDRGTTYVIKAGTAFEKLAQNELGEDVYASPALSAGRLYFRTVKHLVCIGESAK
jgi:hypothetical protein